MKSTGPSFFEGTEKKVELVLDPALPSMRGLGEPFWRGVCRKARAEILSRIGNAHADAYLLSESSLFVFDHKVILITCGRTTLPPAVAEMLASIPRDAVRLLVYERKNEVFPHRQPTSFFEDVGGLASALPGRAYQFGHEDEHHLYLFHLDRPPVEEPEDMTVEVLMYGLDPERCAPFQSAGGDAADVRRRVGLDRILPGFDFDDHLFEPGGYSLNALRDDAYYTVHVTPEEVSSYASFETNARLGDELSDVVARVVDVFRPRSYDLVVFERRSERRIACADYRLKSHVVQDLTCGYRVRFMNFYRPQASVVPAIELPVA